MATELADLARFSAEVLVQVEAAISLAIKERGHQWDDASQQQLRRAKFAVTRDFTKEDFSYTTDILGVIHKLDALRNNEAGRSYFNTVNFELHIVTSSRATDSYFSGMSKVNNTGEAVDELLAGWVRYANHLGQTVDPQGSITVQINSPPITGIGGFIPPPSISQASSAEPVINLIPAPSAGIHVQLNSKGVLDFAPPGSLDEHGNNVDRLNTLQPVLSRIVNSLISALSRGNQPNHAILPLLTDYASNVQVPLKNVNFALLYTLGVEVANYVSALRAAVERGDDDAVSLPFAADANIKSFLQLHGQFMLSSKEGLELLDLEERLNLQPEQVRELRKNGKEFGTLLSNSPELVAPKLATTIIGAADQIGQGTNAARGTAVGVGASQNAVVAVTTVAAVGLLFQAGSSIGGVGSLGFYMAGQVSWEAVKSSKPVKAVLGELVPLIDGLAEADLSKFGEKPRGHLELVRRHASVFERLAAGGEAMAWVKSAVVRIVQQLAPLDSNHSVAADDDLCVSVYNYLVENRELFLPALERWYFGQRPDVSEVELDRRDVRGSVSIVRVEGYQPLHVSKATSKDDRGHWFSEDQLTRAYLVVAKCELLLHSKFEYRLPSTNLDATSANQEPAWNEIEHTEREWVSVGGLALFTFDAENSATVLGFEKFRGTAPRYRARVPEVRALLERLLRDSGR